VKVVMRDALRRRISDATDCIRKSAEPRTTCAQFTTERQRRRRQGNFRKLALSTDKFILNVISRL